jgi:hypothetical protein
MAKTIEDLQLEIDGKVEALDSPLSRYFSKTVKGNMEREITSLKKRIQEILENQVRLGDGSLASEDMTVFGFKLPQLDPNGNVAGYALYARTIQGTKKDLAGRGYVTFQKASKKFERLTWYEAERFYQKISDAQVAIVADLDLERRRAQRILADADEILSFVETHEPPIIDLADDELEEAKS